MPPGNEWSMRHRVLSQVCISYLSSRNGLLRQCYPTLINATSMLCYAAIGVRVIGYWRLRSSCFFCPCKRQFLSSMVTGRGQCYLTAGGNMEDALPPILSVVWESEGASSAKRRRRLCPRGYDKFAKQGRTWLERFILQINTLLFFTTTLPLSFLGRAFASALSPVHAINLCLLWPWYKFYSWIRGVT